MKKIFLLISFALLIVVSSFGQIRIDTTLTTQGIGLPIPDSSVVTTKTTFISTPIDSSGTAKMKREIHFNLDLHLDVTQAGKVGAQPLQGWIKEFPKGFVKELTEAEYQSIFSGVTTSETTDAGIIVMTWLSELIDAKIGADKTVIISITPSL